MEEEESHDGNMQGDWALVKGSQIELTRIGRKYSTTFQEIRIINAMRVNPNAEARRENCGN